ncbi:junctophilin 1 [Echinococcus multilocularis]|uniref:Junctophilin 1 n=1 Tax=Echinococcus multilocularis TaxID=6211 RepID=A0A068XYN4_ECHMU|nr:junctophilin 1 [Echinococcus multilocularis]
MATAEGGRFDFDDGGSYVGEWCENRAHGFGIATGPDNQGEYSGEWNMGFESRGVYVWPSGNLYAGGWLKGKRHGEGVQIKGRWIYRGAFTSGFYGRYGVKESLTTCARYEGSWHLNQFDGFGVETNSDGSIYAGAWSKGMRQGLGVRKSAPWELAAEHHSTVRAAQSQSSLPSTHDSDRGGWRGPGSSGGSAGSVDHIHGGRFEAFRSGFVLKATSYPVGATPPPSRSQSAAPFRSSSNERRTFLKRFLLRKLRKPKSTGDLSSVGPHTISGPGSASSGRFGGLHGSRAGGSLRSNISGVTGNSVFAEHQSRADITGVGPTDSLDEPLGPNVTETYSGQWNEDRRSGYGVAERSDGLRYEGEWFNNKKDGYGVTYHPDGSREEGRYKENIIVQPLMKRTKLYLLRHSKLKDNVEEAVRKARESAKEAQEKSSETAHQRAQTARSVAKTAETRAEEAKNISDQARAIATEFASDFIQMGVQWERNNPFAHMITRSGTPSTTAQVAPNGVTMRLANTNNLFVNSLEVSGGNRRGSFRSSFKRSTSGTLNESNLDGPKPAEEIKPQAAQVQTATVNARSPKFATVQNLEETKFETLGGPVTPAVPSPIGKKPPVLHTAQVVLSNDSQVHMATMEFANTASKPVIEQRVAQGRPMARAATAGFTGPPPLSAFDLMKSGKMPTAPEERKMTRRRTLPSILTTPPSTVPTPQASSKTTTLRRQGIAAGGVGGNASRLSPSSAAALGNPAGEKHFAMPGLSSNLDDVHHSSENLVETYIIEDGVKKRVQPTRASEGGGLLTKGNTPGAAGALRRGHGVSPDRRFKGGDEVRRLAGGTGMPHRLETDFDTGELLPLPDAYKIESVGNLRTGGLETSMPDVSKGVEGMLLSKGGSGSPRLGISGLLTRDEVCRLGQQRRHELLLDRERKKRGEIIIRLADIKDWLCANIVVVMVLLLNLCLAFLFINLVNNAGKLGPPTAQVAELSPEEKRAAASAAAEAVQKALRAANAASRAAASSVSRPKS